MWIKNALYKKYLLKNFWHERSAFQSVAVQAAEWHNDSEPIFSLFFSFFCLFSLDRFLMKDWADEKGDESENVKGNVKDNNFIKKSPF